MLLVSLSAKQKQSQMQKQASSYQGGSSHWEFSTRLYFPGKLFGSFHLKTVFQINLPPCLENQNIHPFMQCQGYLRYVLIFPNCFLLKLITTFLEEKFQSINFMVYVSTDLSILRQILLLLTF